MKPPKDAEFANFTEALKRMLTVPKAEIERRMQEHKDSGKRFPKPTKTARPAASRSLRPTSQA
jgi:hypothetical protein